MSRGSFSPRIPLLAAVCALVAGCGGGTAATRYDRLGLPLNRPVTQQQVRHVAEASLLYPGSVVVRPIGMDEHKQPGQHEPDPAYAGNVAVAPATVDAVLAWYGRQLTARGYRPATYYKLAGQSTGRAWTAPGSREQLQVGIYAPGNATAGPVPAGHVGYEAVLVNYRVTGPPPA